MILFFLRPLRPSLEGPKSLPVTPKCSVEPNTPSPLVICSTSFDHHGGKNLKTKPYYMRNFQPMSNL